MQHPSPAPEAPAEAPLELIHDAERLIRQHPECFWFRHPDARISSLDDIRLVIQHLREHGNRSTWQEAQELQACLMDVEALEKAGYQVDGCKFS